MQEPIAHLRAGSFALIALWMTPAWKERAMSWCLSTRPYMMAFWALFNNFTWNKRNLRGHPRQSLFPMRRRVVRSIQWSYLSLFTELMLLVLGRPWIKRRAIFFLWGQVKVKSVIFLCWDCAGQPWMMHTCTGTCNWQNEMIMCTEKSDSYMLSLNHTLICLWRCQGYG